MTPKYRDEERLELILELISHIDRRLEDMDQARFESDRDEIDLTAFRLEHIGESCKKLSSQIRERHAHIAWPEICAMRNLLAHDYGAIIATRLWKSATSELAPLIVMCQTELVRIRK